MTILPLDHPILLWGINTKGLMDYTSCFKIGRKGLIEIVFSIVRTNSFNVNIELSSHHIIENWKYGTHFKFTFQKVNPSDMSAIINKRQTTEPQ